MRWYTGPLIIISAVCALAGCAQPAPGPEPAEETPGVPLHKRWSQRIGQGGQPQGDLGFATLKRLGYATVLSVDGALPDVKTATRHGLRTVHVPIGYDGIGREAALKIIKAVQTSPGPVFIHCHHGKHRGSAAAIVARIGLEGLPHQRAVEDLKASGCAPRYQGLYTTVARFERPTAKELAAIPQDLPSQVAPKDIAANMVRVSKIWTRLEACQKAGWRQPPQHPDVDPPHEATLLWEQLRELQRLGAARAQGKEFREHARRSEVRAKDLRDALRRRERKDAGTRFKSLRASCKRCHTRFRDP